MLVHIMYSSYSNFNNENICFQDSPAHTLIITLPQTCNINVLWIYSVLWK